MATLRKSIRSADAEFDVFWAAYPRRVAKGAARKAWGKAVKKTEADAIMSALEKQRSLGAFNVEPCYIPHPATWLNQERWDDEPTPPSLPRPGNANYLKPEGGGGYGF